MSSTNDTTNSNTMAMKASSSSESNSNDEGGSPFITDRYILPDEWDSGLAKAWITKVSIPMRNVALSDWFNSEYLAELCISQRALYR